MFTVNTKNLSLMLRFRALVWHNFYLDVSDLKETYVSQTQWLHSDALRKEGSTARFIRSYDYPSGTSLLGSDALPQGESLLSGPDNFTPTSYIKGFLQVESDWKSWHGLPEDVPETKGIKFSFYTIDFFLGEGP